MNNRRSNRTTVGTKPSGEALIALKMRLEELKLKSKSEAILDMREVIELGTLTAFFSDSNQLSSENKDKQTTANTAEKRLDDDSNDDPKLKTGKDTHTTANQLEERLDDLSDTKWKLGLVKMRLEELKLKSKSEAILDMREVIELGTLYSFFSNNNENKDEQTTATKSEEHGSSAPTHFGPPQDRTGFICGGPHPLCATTAIYLLKLQELGAIDFDIAYVPGGYGQHTAVLSKGKVIPVPEMEFRRSVSSWDQCIICIR